MDDWPCPTHLIDEILPSLVTRTHHPQSRASISADDLRGRGPRATRGSNGGSPQNSSAACRIRIEAFVEEVTGDSRRTRNRGMTKYVISASPSSPPLCGAATNRVGLEPAPSMTAEQEGN